MEQRFLSRGRVVLPALLVLACQGGRTPDPAAQANPPAAVEVAVKPATAAVAAGGKQAFSATVTTTGDTSVNWSVAEGAGAGSITNAGVYSAPSTSGTFHVVATSVADPSRAGSATVTVQPPPASVTIAPVTAALAGCTAKTFTATVTNAATAAVDWSVQEGAAGGTVDASGKYTAPGAPGTYHLVATSQAVPAASATATITVATQVLGVAVSPATSSAPVNGVVTFTATVTTTCGQFTATRAFAQTR